VLKIKEMGDLKVTKSTKRYVDNSKVTDHYAIIPTYVNAETYAWMRIRKMCTTLL